MGLPTLSPLIPKIDSRFCESPGDSPGVRNTHLVSSRKEERRQEGSRPHFSVEASLSPDFFLTSFPLPPPSPLSPEDLVFPLCHGDTKTLLCALPSAYSLSSPKPRGRAITVLLSPPNHLPNWEQQHTSHFCSFLGHPPWSREPEPSPSSLPSGNSSREQGRIPSARVSGAYSDLGFNAGSSEGASSRTQGCSVLSTSDPDIVSGPSPCGFWYPMPTPGPATTCRFCCPGSWLAVGVTKPWRSAS